MIEDVLKFQKMIKKYKEKDYEYLHDNWRHIAESECAPAQYYFGIMWEKGQGCSIDYGKALEYYMGAAKQGYPPAQNSLGMMFFKGRGVDKRDYEKALECFRLATCQGHAKAILFLCITKLLLLAGLKP